VLAYTIASTMKPRRCDYGFGSCTGKTRSMTAAPSWTKRHFFKIDLTPSVTRGPPVHPICRRPTPVGSGAADGGDGGAPHGRTTFATAGGSAWLGLGRRRAGWPGFNRDVTSGDETCIDRRRRPRSWGWTGWRVVRELRGYFLVPQQFAGHHRLAHAARPTSVAGRQVVVAVPVSRQLVRLGELLGHHGSHRRGGHTRRRLGRP
jgi:hypothetical protein